MAELLRQGLDYYTDPDGKMVLTREFLLERGYCCSNGCRHCPYGYALAPAEKFAKLGLATMTSPPKPQDADSFYESVFRIARSIPRGKVTTYGAIAEAAGTRLSARMVGWAMNAAHRVNPPVPAHRVVNRNGMLTGRQHFATPTLMQELLENEGITVKDDTVVDFPKLFWNPAQKK